MEKIVALCKRRGFIYPGSEIYGGLGGTWDYGPLGAELKRNIKNVWWKDVVQLREDMVGVDTSIMLNPKVWEASGHVEAFTDPLVECKVCHARIRADAKDEIEKHGKSHDKKVDWTEPQKFNLLVKAYLGVLEDKQAEIYLRGEITQGVHVNFKNVLDSSRVKLPFGIAQIGKAFRNEITPGNFTFRSREFEQMEVQYYINPQKDEGEKWYEYWKKFWMDWYISLGINGDNLHFKDHKEGERAHYAKAATDIEYNSPFGWAEFMGIHHRGDWDLSRHEQYSGQSMKYKDPETGEEFIPWDIESSAGIDRSALFFLIDAYTEDDKRVYLKLHPKLAPFKAAVFPLLANKPDLVKLAREIYEDLKQDLMVAWDERGNIGGRYASQDEIGTPFCITVDFQSLEDKTVTVRDRDTTKQDRVKIVDLRDYLNGKIK
ncbi:glycine--tRNA ligase [Candidatus Daviesbacteria bacterium]|nr:glycine--tRNA ligase [Candidatus Daviesbacteria bacterium]